MGWVSGLWSSPARITFYTFGGDSAQLLSWLSLRSINSVFFVSNISDMFSDNIQKIVPHLLYPMFSLWCLIFEVLDIHESIFRGAFMFTGHRCYLSHSLGWSLLDQWYVYKQLLYMVCHNGNFCPDMVPRWANQNSPLADMEFTPSCSILCLSHSTVLLWPEQCLRKESVFLNSLQYTILFWP